MQLSSEEIGSVLVDDRLRIGDNEATEHKSCSCDECWEMHCYGVEGRTLSSSSQCKRVVAGFFISRRNIFLYMYIYIYACVFVCVCVCEVCAARGIWEICVVFRPTGTGESLYI